MIVMAWHGMLATHDRLVAAVDGFAVGFSTCHVVPSPQPGRLPPPPQPGRLPPPPPTRADVLFGLPPCSALPCMQPGSEWWVTPAGALITAIREARVLSTLAAAAASQPAHNKPGAPQTAFGISTGPGGLLPALLAPSKELAAHESVLDVSGQVSPQQPTWQRAGLGWAGVS